MNELSGLSNSSREGMRRGRGSVPPVRVAGAARRRRVPYLLLGVLLVVGCATGGVVASLSLGHRESVLELGRPVSVGQALSAADLREVSISTDTELTVIPASAKAKTVGRPVAYSLPAGTLLTRGVLGAVRVPPAGQGVAAVAVKAGQAPPGLQAGDRVAVVEAPSSDTTGTASPQDASSWPAVVLGVAKDGTDQSAVVSLQLAEQDARLVAAAPAGQISVVIVHGGGGR